MKRLLAVGGLLAVLAAAVATSTPGGRTSGAAATAPVPRPAVSEFQQLGTSETPPTEAQCFAANPPAGRRCFTPQSIRAAYNVGPLYARGFDGRGQTIAIVDSYGSDTMAADLKVFDDAFGLPHLCGEPGVACTPGMAKFSELSLQGSPETKPQGGSGTGLEDKTGWAIEVALDVEWAHAIAPGANILLVHTPTAETLGVQGFPQMMMAEDYVVKHGLAQVISQSLASAEDAFGSPQSLLNLRYAFEDAKDAGVTVLGSSGDSGTANVTKQALVGNGTGGPTGGLIPTPSVVWPASDPLVTGVGGTNLCSDPLNTSSRVLDAADPPTTCRGQGEIEIGWIGSGGGFSHVFGRPSFQDALPAGSTAIPADARGVPDVAYDASARTGVLVYVTLPPAGLGGLPCPGGPCSTGWYVVGGTSAGSPQWAGLIAIADQLNGGGLGWINPALYEIGADPARYAADFFDVTTGNNTQPGTGIPGYPATTGWDPVTGLGTPNAAVFLPDLVAAVNGH